MARPKRTYNQETGQWEVQKLWDSQDDQGKYWKNGVQVDSKGRPWKPITKEQAAANTSTPGTGVGGGKVPEVGDESIDIDDPRNIIMGSSTINLITGEYGVGERRRGQSQTTSMNPSAKPGTQRRAIRAKKTLITGTA